MATAIIIAKPGASEPGEESKPSVEIPSSFYEGECKVGDPITLTGKVTEKTDTGVVVGITSAEMETPPEDQTESGEEASMTPAMKAAVMA